MGRSRLSGALVNRPDFPLFAHSARINGLWFAVRDWLDDIGEALAYWRHVRVQREWPPCHHEGCNEPMPHCHAGPWTGSNRTTPSE